MIIIDLDDTIFETSSMNPSIFDSAMDVIKKHYRNLSNSIYDQLVRDLWAFPIDKVFEKYATSEDIINQFYNKLATIDYSQVKIKPFDDYTEVQSLNTEKILVTTGLSELQNAKIDALGIRLDFKSIYIDDPRRQPRNTKFKIFNQILQQTDKSANQIWVIGDNPESEIKAAYLLGLNTIQRKSLSKIRSNMSGHYIDSFYELNEILNL